MSDQAKPTMTPWYRRIKPWQFSLRSLLVLMAIASAVCWYYLRPKQHEEKLADGHLILQRQYRGKGEITVQLGGPARKFEGYNDGSWQLSDFRGRLLTSGSYDKGKESGWWSSYHLNGRLATQGKMQAGQRIGVWKTWSPEGKLSSELTFGPQSQPTLQPGNAALQGSAKFWHANGKLAAQGTFQDNEKTGRWEEWTESGETTAVGEYLNGRKQGEWREYSAEEKKLVTRQYVAGQRKEVIDEQLRQLTDRIEQGDLTQRLTLLNVAADLGPPAVPLLEKFAGSVETPQERLAAISGIVRCQGKLDAWLPALQTIEAGDDGELAAAARWEIYRGIPAQREATFHAVLQHAEQLVDTSWPDAFGRLRIMFAEDADHRAEIFAAILRISPPDVHFRASWAPWLDPTGEIKSTWLSESIPHLDRALDDPNPQTRLTAVRLMRHVLSEQNEPFRPFVVGAGMIYPDNARWAVPNNLKALVEKSRRDSDPDVKELADTLDQPVFGPQQVGGGGLF